MVHKILLFSVLLLFASLLAAPSAHAFVAAKPELTLNLEQGPLGVTLSLKGKNCYPGQANLSYIDAQGVPGTFVPPSDSSVQIQVDGTFSTNNVILPSSGPVGVWRILVTDSSGVVWTVSYQVLAAVGAQEASKPGLTVNPGSGAGGDLIAFTGSNWLPQGTAVKLTLLTDTTALLLLDTPSKSDKNGTITGAFHLPNNLNVSQATVTATDVSTGALRSQAQILIVGSSPTPSASPTVVASPTSAVTATSVPSPTAEPSPTSTPVKKGVLGPDSTGGSSSPFSREGLGIVLLIVGGTLGIAATMLILFLIPWSERKGNEPGGRHY